jgi:hypothetical protein
VKKSLRWVIIETSKLVAEAAPVSVSGFSESFLKGVRFPPDL